MKLWICRYSDLGCELSRQVNTFFGGDKELQKYAIIAFGIVVLSGIILGLLGKVIVFRDYADVSTVVTSIAGPPITLFVVAMLKLKTTTAAFVALKYLGLGIEAILLLATLVGTWRDNRSLWKTPLALLTKYTICLAFVVVGFFLMMGGDARRKGESYVDYRARNDHSRKLWLGVLASISGLIGLLVRNQAFVSTESQEPQSLVTSEEERRAA